MVIETAHGTLVLPPGYRFETGDSLQRVLSAATKVLVEEFEQQNLLDLESMD